MFGKVRGCNASSVDHTNCAQQPPANCFENFFLASNRKKYFGMEPGSGIFFLKIVAIFSIISMLTFVNKNLVYEPVTS